MGKTLFFVTLLMLKYTHGLVLVESLDGVVPRENFSYVTLNYGGNVILELITKEGDADLYVSERSLKPSYEPERYDLHSATCGKDTVYIPRSFLRPLGVGVYGHAAHDFSYYTLEVYVVTRHDDLELVARFEDVERRYESYRRRRPSPTVVAEDTAPATPENRQVMPPEKKKTNARLKKVLTKSGLWALLEMFEMIFL